MISQFLMPSLLSSVPISEEEDPYLSLIGEYLCRTARAKSVQCLVESGPLLTFMLLIQILL
jgi:hypothetical protein